MSYIEDAVYSFIKGIFTKGVVVLTNKRFVTYTIISMLLPIILTVYTFIKGGEASMVYSLIFNFELATCMALVITGLISLKLQMIKIEHAFFFTILLLKIVILFLSLPTILITSKSSSITSLLSSSLILHLFLILPLFIELINFFSVLCKFLVFISSTIMHL